MVVVTPTLPIRISWPRTHAPRRSSISFHASRAQLVRVVDLAENYRDLISGSLEAYLSVVSNRLNEIMKVLTIFSAIMLPLTFIAGVYGMNFENMPELHSRYGYYAVWALMIVVAIGMLLFFKRRGWIGSKSREEQKG